MNAKSNPDEGYVLHGHLFLPSLVVSNFASGSITVWAALLLFDMSKSFNTSVGVMGQINTAYSVAAFVCALLTGVLSVRFQHRSLLLAGLVLTSLSAVGCFLAQDYAMILVSYSISGVGFAMVSPMAFALIGEHLLLKKRANAIGLVVAGGALAYIIGAPAIAVVSGFTDWRFPVMGFVVPVLLMSILLAFLGLPRASASRQASVDRTASVKGFRGILLNRSAVACLACDCLRSAAFVAIVLYVTSFVEQRFSMPTETASVVLLVGALCYTLGSLLSGLFVSRYGRKFSVVVTALLSGVFTASYAYAPSLWLSLILIFAASWMFGMVASAANNLTLEQLPELRGAMMSMDSAVVNLGSAFGTALGGMALIAFNYEGMGSVLGVLSVGAAVVVFALARDPTREDLRKA